MYLDYLINIIGSVIEQVSVYSQLQLRQLVFF